ncbi:aldehyde dehydrogenase family protein [Brevundimonas faecalis]|uniref:aldehyde dehydrogenase family protein n=1 Tax=Brevundimonas faecalis TaxID=947378 RepID=UPI003606075E
MKMAAVNPRTGERDYEFAAASAQDVADVAAALRRAQPEWLALGVQGRVAALSRWADAVAAHRLPIIAALAQDTGRWFLSETEVDGAVRNLRRWAALAPEMLGDDMRGPEKASALIPTVRYQNQSVPYPLSGFISPWNFPVTLSLIDAVPALAAGSAALIKPSEVTPRFVAPLLETLEAVPELKSVLAFVLGDSAVGQALIDQVDLVCFTGSVATGRKVAEAAARRFIPASLELGGKDPVVILESADLEQAVDAVLRGGLSNSGQACLSIERVYVQRAIHDAFLDKLADKASRLTLNWPDIHSGHLGPLIHAPQADIIERQLKDAVAKGARVLTGGEIRTDGGGRWCPATVLADVTHDMEIMREETFGPVLPVMAFDTADEAVALANDTTFGLSGAVIAGTVEEALPVAERINAGGLSVNDCALTILTYEPEKNSFGLSGMGGSRMGPASINRFLRRKALIMQSGVPAPLDVLEESRAPSRA